MTYLAANFGAAGHFVKLNRTFWRSTQGNQNFNPIWSPIEREHFFSFHNYSFCYTVWVRYHSLSPHKYATDSNHVKVYRIVQKFLAATCHRTPSAGQEFLAEKKISLRQLQKQIWAEACSQTPIINLCTL